MKPFVTLSASFGAGGSQIGPALAAQLSVPFFDRAIVAQVADRLDTSTSDPMLQEARPAGLLRRLLASYASTVPLYTAAALLPDAPPIRTEREYRAELDRVIRAAADGGTGGVLLGRAGAVVLAGHRAVLHVRLDGPLARRIARVTRELGLDEASASRRVRDNDRAREAYVRQLYDADPHDPSLYDLTIDATSLPVGTCIELITIAADRSVRPRTVAGPTG